MKFISILLVIITGFNSCNSAEDSKSDEIILGKWIFAREYYIPYYLADGIEQPPPPPKTDSGFNFFSRDSVKNNRSFFRIIDSRKDHRFEDNVVITGSNTKYLVSKDSLKIFDQTFNKWKSYEIIRLDENNLILNDNDVIIKNYVKVLKQ